MLKLEFNNKGSTRFIICLGKYAIKIPKLKTDNKFYGNLFTFLNGWKGNRYEYIWSKANIYPYLAKVRISLFFSLIIIMDRARPIDRDDFLLIDKNDYSFGGYEFKMDSFGVVKNRIVIIDYDGLN